MNPTPSPNPTGPTPIALHVEIAQVVSLSTPGPTGLRTGVNGTSNNTRHIIADCSGPPSAVAAWLRQMAEEIDHPLYVVTMDGNQVGSSWLDQMDQTNPQVKAAQHEEATRRATRDRHLPDGPPQE